MKKIFIFPGQGSQYVGMGKSLLENFPIAKEYFTQADEALGFSLSNLCLQGPEADLKLTQNTQPAILTVSVAAYAVLSKETDLQADYVAGHSLGEYSALVAAGALAFHDAVKLVHLRGKFMQEAVPAGRGAMAAMIGGTESAVKSLLQEAERRSGKKVEMANFNGGGQIVVSGEKEAVEEAAKLAQSEPSYGVGKAVILPVSAPFHCSLMKKAEENLWPYLQKINVGSLRCPYIANVSAEPVSESNQIIDNLRKQICSSVKWEQSMLKLSALGVSEAYEVGPGKVLSGLMRRIDKGIKCRGVETLEDIQALKA